MAETRMITRDEYLKALALFTLGHEHSLKCYEIEAALKSLLRATDEFGDGIGQVTDLLYSSNRTTVAEFDEHLKRGGYVVQGEP